MQLLRDSKTQVFVSLPSSNCAFARHLRVWHAHIYELQHQVAYQSQRPERAGKQFSRYDQIEANQ